MFSQHTLKLVIQLLVLDIRLKRENSKHHLINPINQIIVSRRNWHKIAKTNTLILKQAQNFAANNLTKRKDIFLFPSAKLIYIKNQPKNYPANYSSFSF